MSTLLVLSLLQPVLSRIHPGAPLHNYCYCRCCRMSELKIACYSVWYTTRLGACARWGGLRIFDEESRCTSHRRSFQFPCKWQPVHGHNKATTVVVDLRCWGRSSTRSKKRFHSFLAEDHRDVRLVSDTLLPSGFREWHGLRLQSPDPPDRCLTMNVERPVKALRAIAARLFTALTGRNSIQYKRR